MPDIPDPPPVRSWPRPGGGYWVSAEGFGVIGFIEPALVSAEGRRSGIPRRRGGDWRGAGDSGAVVEGRSRDDAALALADEVARLAGARRVPWRS